MVSATNIDRLLVSSGLSGPISTLIGNDEFCKSCHTDLRPKRSPKIGNFEFSCLSRRDRARLSDCLELLMHYQVLHCATGGASNFRVLICGGLRDSTFKSLYPLFGWPSSYQYVSSLTAMYDGRALRMCSLLCLLQCTLAHVD